MTITTELKNETLFYVDNLSKDNKLYLLNMLNKMTNANQLNAKKDKKELDNKWEKLADTLKVNDKIIFIYKGKQNIGFVTKVNKKSFYVDCEYGIIMRPKKTFRGKK